MAINNWRYVITWDPRERTPDNEMVRQLKAAQLGTDVNNVSNVVPVTRTFPLAEEYWLKSQWYANQGNTTMANAFGGLANDLWRYSSFANTALNNYDALLKYIQWNEAGLQWVAWQLYNQLTWDIENQRNYINSVFGPEWTLTKEVNTYYDDLGNYLATEAWREAAKIAAQGVHSWASLWAIRAQQNRAYNESFGRYIQAKEQQINAKQQLAANLINYMSTLRQEYWDTTNQYIIELYKRANDMYNAIAQSAASDLREYNNLRLSGWSSSTSWLHYDVNWNLVNSNWEIVMTKEQVNSQNNQTVYWPRIDNLYTNATTGAWKATYWLDNIAQPYTVA